MKKRKLKIKNIILLLLIPIIIIFLFNTIYPKLSLLNKLIISQKANIDYDTLTSLTEMSKEDSRINKIIKNIDAYPSELLEMLSRNPDMTDYALDYLNKKGEVTSDNIGEVIKGKFPLLLQYDERWGYGIYGDNVIAIKNWGPTVLTMVIAGLTGRNDITPYDIAAFSEREEYYQEEGTSWLLFTEGIKQYGITGENIPLSESIINENLIQGHPIICSMRKGTFTTTGHFILLTGVKDGKYIVNDPNSRERSNTLYSYDEISYQIKNIWSFHLDT